jgi:NosR/NirI family transcriptional regulator, nitrous oxide reductase regulator
VKRQLPTIDAKAATGKSLRLSTNLWARVAYSLRLLLIAAFITGLHTLATQRAARKLLNAQPTLALESVTRVLPSAARLELVMLGTDACYKVTDLAGHPLALAVTTSPQADRIIGYSGPSNILLLLDEQQRVTHASLLNSGDTVEHVNQVERDAAFWQQFVGRAMGQSYAGRVDGVSGATLTSLAIAESVLLRMSGQRQSLRFPDPIRIEEATSMLPEAVRIESAESVNSEGVLEGAGAVALYNSAGEPVGWIARTGPLVDSEEGYQGPTELLLAFNRDLVLVNAKIRKSYDNEPYVGYVKQEYSFWARFKGRSLADLAKLDLQQEGIEGVSGATMTSLAVARTLASSLQRVSESRGEPKRVRRWNWSIPEVATAVLALAGIVWSRSRWRGDRWPRWVWQCICLLVLGVFSGNLLSIALFAGWTRGGVPYTLAPGLCVLLIVAIVWPVISKQNVYCDHICPHGALQQWLIRRRSSQMREFLKADGKDKGGSESGRSVKWKNRLWMLELTPILAIGTALGWVLWDWPVALAWLEPFDAYSWRIGFSVSALVWISSLALSYLRPMTYCRLLCPTGKILSFVRRSRRTNISNWLDGLLGIMTTLVWWLVGFA